MSYKKEEIKGLNRLELPFFVKCLTEGEKYSFPDALPLHIYFEKELGALRQKENKTVNEYLEIAYQYGSLFEGSLSNESGLAYLKPFYEFILNNSKDFENILEIGCGNGQLLKLLTNKFNNLVGIEPSEKVNEIEGITIVKGFFPNDLTQKKYLNIVHFGVLEHIPDSINFLSSHKGYLENNGRLTFAVPDCSVNYEEGDISMFFHEHFTYFNEDNIDLLLRKTGFSIIKKEKVLGMLFVSAQVQVKNCPTIYLPNTFEIKLKRKLASVRKTLNFFSETEIAVYPALRAINYLHLFNKKSVRLVDDSTELEGKFIPGFEKTIESFKTMENHPPKMILITSNTFKKQIKEKIENSLKLQNCQIEYL